MQRRECVAESLKHNRYSTCTSKASRDAARYDRTRNTPVSNQASLMLHRFCVSTSSLNRSVKSEKKVTLYESTRLLRHSLVSHPLFISLKQVVTKYWPRYDSANKTGTVRRTRVWRVCMFATWTSCESHDSTHCGHIFCRSSQLCTVTHCDLLLCVCVRA